MEREGVRHIQRAIPDVPINEFKRAETQGLEVISKSFHGNEVQDTSYESMIQEQYQNTIYAKVEGTWNLHNALKSCGSNL
ncbi:hypothetical protein BDV24DRAFT_170184 [Aspergillus arachidicola]|uniref:Ketoreductase (KR) domain-containing protein n=1 Tax=Aspergillus arachidicola TaxID=656916 RepID=A0A5N6XMG9_9EURO|nr:hypothetical protein BDV24DRAFT_170184 [Aspergillus arachidicola]